MKRLWRTILWIAAAVFVLLIAVVAAVLIFTRTARFNNFLRVQIVDYLAQTYHGRITIDRIEGSVWGNLTLYDIEVHHGNKAIAVIPKLRVGYLILPALHRQIVVSEIDAIGPELHLARDPDGRWNLLAAISERHPSPRTSATMNIALRRFSIEHARISVATQPSVIYRLTDGNFQGAGQLGLSGETFNVGTISFALVGPKIIPLKAQGAARYNEAAQVAGITIPNFSIWTDHSRIDFNGSLRDFSEKNVNATLELRKLASVDVNSVMPQAKLARDISGTLRIHGNASDMRASMLLAAADARLKVDGEANLLNSEPVWKLNSQVAGVELRNLMKRDSRELPAGKIEGTVRAAGAGFALPSVNGEVDTHITALALRGSRLGDLTFTGTLDHQIANLKSLLAGPGGRARLAGRVNIAKVPAYDLTLALEHLRARNVVNNAAIPYSELNLKAALDGSGYEPNTMRLRAQVRIAPSTVRSIRVDSGLLDAQLSSGVVHIAAASLRAADTSVDVGGQLALNSRGSGTLNYKVAVGQLSKWLALAGRSGSGSIKLAGRAQGSLKDLRTNGSAQFFSLHFGNYSVAGAHLIYDVSGLGKPMKPAGHVMLTANNLHSAVELKSLQTSIRLIPGTGLGADVNLNAEDSLSRPAAMRADFAYRRGFATVNLKQLSVATGHGSWQLTGPAQLSLRGTAVEVRHFAAVNQDQSAAIDGIVGQSGEQSMSLRLQRIRLGDFATLMPRQVKVTGSISSDVTIRGTAAAPVIAMSANLSQLKLADFPKAAMSVKLSYANGHTQAEAIITQDAAHSLDANAAIPLDLSWAHGFVSRPAGDLDLRATSNGLNLAVLNAFHLHQINDIGGILTLDIVAHGPLHHPLPRGYIRLSEAHASAPQLKVDVTGAAADIQLNGGEVRLVSLSAKAGDGTLTGAGVITLTPIGTPDNVDVHIVLDRWPAIATHQYNATVAARVGVLGPLKALHVDGQLEVLYGVFRPDLSVTGSAPRPDESITVVHQWSVNPQHPPARIHSASQANPMYRNLAIDMNIVIDRDTWIKTSDFAVELEGHLRIHKIRGGEPAVSGAIKTVRGTLVVAGQQLDLARGEITFTGGHEINPELMIVAQRRVQNYTVSATVSGTASKPTLTLSSTPELPQADILSVMMFGKTTSQLSAGQQKGLQNQALSMAGGYAASRIGQAVAQSLGLSSLGVTSSSSGVGFGHYVTKNIYVSASQSAQNMAERRAEIQYYVTPNINLNTSASTNYGNEIKLQWHKEY